MRTNVRMHVHCMDPEVPVTEHQSHKLHQTSHMYKTVSAVIHHNMEYSSTSCEDDVKEVIINWPHLHTYMHSGLLWYS